VRFLDKSTDRYATLKIRRKMKSKLIAKFTHNWTAATILLTLVSLSNSNAMTTIRRAHQTPRVGKTTIFRFVEPERNQVDSWYQPPRSPGYNEDFGS
jgi:hypothetical protein